MNIDSILPVARHHLLLANAVVWGAPGVMVLVTGVQSYLAIWPSRIIVCLALGTVAVLAGFLWMFSRIVSRYSERIMAFPEKKKSILAEGRGDGRIGDGQGLVDGLLPGRGPCASPRCSNWRRGHRPRQPCPRI